MAGKPAVAVSGGALTVRNCTLAGHKGAGAVHVSGGDVAIEESLLANNSAPGGIGTGGGALLATVHVAHLDAHGALRMPERTDSVVMEVGCSWVTLSNLLCTKARSTWHFWEPCCLDFEESFVLPLRRTNPYKYWTH